MVNRPTLYEHLQFEWIAFSAVRSDRAVGMGLCPIPWSSIDRLAERYHIVADDFDRLVRIIRAMDDADRDHQEKP